MKYVGIKYLGLKPLILIGLLVATIPFWLPTFAGGAMSYHFVLTESMKGSVDPGSFVVLRHADNYRIGDVVGFRHDLGDEDSATILHRVVGIEPEGRYLIKGDAVPATEEIDKELITGRMVLAIPYLGFIPGAFGSFPQLFLVAFLAFFLLPGLLKKSDSENGRRRGLLFLVACVVVLVSFPFAELGPAAQLGSVPLLIILLGFLTVTRLADATVDNRRVSPLVQTNYMLVMVLAISAVPLGKMIDSLREAVGL